MNIEDLLRETLSEMADEERPPAPSRFLQGRSLQAREHRPRRRGLALMAAAGVVALAVGATFVVRGLSPGTSGEAAGQPDAVASVVPEQRPAITVIVPPGMRLAQLLKRLSSVTGRPVAEFERAARDGAALGLPPYAKGRLEGFAAPGSYEISPAMSPGEILGAMVTGFGRLAEETGLVAGAGRAGRTPLEILTIASIVQAESFRPEDMPKIARVLHNRLDRKMRLQVDSTVLYGLGKYGSAATPEDVRSPSPYNTYRRPGLPPGPIGSPGADAVRAALEPAAGRWLYYVATDPRTGAMKFATTQTEYAALVEERDRNQ
ncbi:endolytic transglycosylase MltG [Nonomuraea gerenzanensis]|uniref:Endolytic murein transglycosylase n=1 Tax=Nonomuraea gerenzanensis TaxID=93944 RepID=Q7WZ93_9ACTN|nr:endolytic transglycosylase MltG [Nonomuraea gerenzanensis]UBU14909.1 endolytic transglycosylase MltG [Nonomuraea gerenzanensis]CAD91193.1 hypothetical protein [Nonomuraea gerenzanensis]SBO92645.1 FIG004453: protein YceG like [Nonomuraea gerenzanensis]